MDGEGEGDEEDLLSEEYWYAMTTRQDERSFACHPFHSKLPGAHLLAPLGFASHHLPSLSPVVLVSYNNALIKPCIGGFKRVRKHHAVHKASWTSPFLPHRDIEQPLASKPLSTMHFVEASSCRLPARSCPTEQPLTSKPLSTMQFSEASSSKCTLGSLTCTSITEHHPSYRESSVEDHSWEHDAKR